MGWTMLNLYLLDSWQSSRQLSYSASGITFWQDTWATWQSQSKSNQNILEFGVNRCFNCTRLPSIWLACYWHGDVGWHESKGVFCRAQLKERRVGPGQNVNNRFSESLHIGMLQPVTINRHLKFHDVIWCHEVFKATIWNPGFCMASTCHKREDSRFLSCMVILGTTMNHEFGYMYHSRSEHLDIAILFFCPHMHCSVFSVWHLQVLTPTSHVCLYNSITPDVTVQLLLNL